MTLRQIMCEACPVSARSAAKVAKCAREFSCRKGEKLVTQGMECNDIFFVSSGMCRGLFRGGENDDTRWFSTEGDVLTSVTAWRTGAVAVFSIEAITDVKGWCVSFEDMRSLLREDAELAAWAIDVLMETLLMCEKRLQLFGSGNAAARYEAVMSKYPKGVMQRIPLKYIAQYLKITQETLSRVRRQYVRKHRDPDTP